MKSGAGLNVRVDGSEENPALLLLHGLLSSNLQWRPNWDALQKHFRLVAVELWGHGASASPRDPELYRVGAYIAELEALREELGIDGWFACGQSFGAGIVIRYAIAHPKVVRGLVLTNSRSALNDVSTETQGSAQLADWEKIDLQALPFHPSHAKRFEPELKQRMEEAADAVEAHALWQSTQTTLQDLSCREFAADISVPVLLVNGRWEKSFQADRDFALATIPDIAVVDLEAGHSVNIEAASEFNAAVIDFAKRATRS